MSLFNDWKIYLNILNSYKIAQFIAEQWKSNKHKKIFRKNYWILYFFASVVFVISVLNVVSNEGFNPLSARIVLLDRIIFLGSLVMWIIMKKAISVKHHDLCYSRKDVMENKNNLFYFNIAKLFQRLFTGYRYILD